MILYSRRTASFELLLFWLSKIGVDVSHDRLDGCELLTRALARARLIYPHLVLADKP